MRAVNAPVPTTVEAIEPPVAKVVPTSRTLHGVTWNDDYAWLRDRDDPDTVAYLEAENAYTEAVMRHTQPLQQELYDEMVARIQETDVSAPTTIDGWQYYHRTEAGKQYAVHCRCPVGSEIGDGEQVVVDENRLAEGHAFLRLGVLDVSPSGDLVAYSVNTSGDEMYSLFVARIEDGSVIDGPIDRTYYGVAWTEDSSCVYYSTLDDTMRPHRVWRHRLGENPSADVLVHDETDLAFYVRVGKTRSHRFIVINSASLTTSEVWLLDAASSDATPRVVQGRTRGLEYEVEHHGDHLLIRTNLDAVDFRVMCSPVEHTGTESWRELVPHRPGTKVVDIDAFSGHLVLDERSEGLTSLRVHPIASRSGALELGDGHLVEMPDEVYSISPARNPTFDVTAFRFIYTSLVEPVSTYEHDMVTGARALIKRTPVLGGYDPTAYRTERRFATATDGVRIPISLVYRRGVALDDSTPLLLYGYGSYGYCTDPEFAHSRISLLDRGWVFAIAHIRGGTELGETWWHDGKLLNKRNSFTDFIACAEDLVAAGYTSPRRIAIQGGSAGGLLMGAVTNLRPDLFRAVVAEVPFVDVINTILDPSLPLSVLEFEEWGDPNDPEYFRYMSSYSPYDNVTDQDYPNMLVIGGLNDPRVSYWEPAKWVARLRACKTGDNVVLLKTNMGAGHSGASGRYDYLREISFKCAFMIDRTD